MPSPRISRILYIDDDQDMLLLIKAVLEQDSDLQVKTYTSPVKALAEIKTYNPELIILDFQIPEMNGTQIMKRIHEMELDIPIIFFTAQSAPEEITKIKSMGAAKVIVKPIDINQLREKLLLV